MKKYKGSLQEKSGKWYLVLNVKFQDGTKQKWFPLNLPVDAPKKDVYQKIAEINNRVDNEQMGALEDTMLADKYGNLTLNYFIDLYLEYKKDKVQRVTYDDYCGDTKTIKKYFSQVNLKLRELNLIHIQGFVNYLIDKKLSAKSINRYLNMLYDIFSYAIFLGILKKNIIKQIERPKVKKIEYHYYDAEQIKDLCKKLEEEDSIYSLPIIITATYGLRRSEIIGLLWSSIDFEQDKIYINNKVICSQKGNEKITYSSHIMKTKASERTLPLLPEIKVLLKKKQQRITDNIIKAGSKYNNDYVDYVCVDDNGNRLKAHTLYINFTKLLKKYNMPHIRFHDLRHSCASMLVASKMPIKTIQEWLGHSNYKTTANIYSHTDYKMQIESGNTVEDVLFSKKKNSLSEQQLQYIKMLNDRLNDLEQQIQNSNEETNTGQTI